MNPSFEFGLSLLAAHLLGDYVLQTKRMALGKKQWRMLGLHVAIQALLAYVLAGRFDAWWIPVIVGSTHALIDRLKAAVPRGGVWAHMVDQLAHLAVIGVMMQGLSAAEEVSWWSDHFGPATSQAWILISGAILTVRVAGIFIGFWVQPYLKEIEQAGGDRSVTPMARGLTNGGRVIGQWERALIFLLVGVGQPAGIGFLIAAKSIFRFGELKDRENRMEAEYITIGTLMSFGWATVSAYLTWWLFRR
ncbi:MAG TPA: DUF3307 domain-containing protein [Opitutaceae bacterium]|nr:DUF3307 domain-containing protein [Opitutaceae bacterium]